MQDYGFDEIIYSYAIENGYQGNDQNFYKFSEYCNSDVEGKELYYVLGMSADDYGGGAVYDNYEYAVIVNEDGFLENSIVEITDLEGVIKRCNC